MLYLQLSVSTQTMYLHCMAQKCDLGSQKDLQVWKASRSCLQVWVLSCSSWVQGEICTVQTQNHSCLYWPKGMFFMSVLMQVQYEAKRVEHEAEEECSVCGKKMKKKRYTLDWLTWHCSMGKHMKRNHETASKAKVSKPSKQQVFVARESVAVMEKEEHEAGTQLWLLSSLIF